MFEEIIGREGMIKSAKDYGVKVGEDISHNILDLTKKVNWYVESLQQIKNNQEQWYPYIGLTIEDLEKFKDYLERQVTIFRFMSQK